MGKILDGKLVASHIKEETKKIAQKYIEEKQKKITLEIITVGEDSASNTYAKNQQKDCDYCGINVKQTNLSSDVNEKELLNIIENANDNDEITGIIVHLPLPKHINEQKVISSIKECKDVDGMTPNSLGKLLVGENSMVPCTPAGVVEILNYYNLDVTGKNCVIIGRSSIVGKPLSMLMTNLNATVTLCHSKTQNIKDHTQKADIIIVAVGSSKFLTDDMVGESSIIIDVGINYENGKLVGDVDFDKVSSKCQYITPVPGGVGAVTRVMLMKNTVKAFEIQNKLI